VHLAAEGLLALGLLAAGLGVSHLAGVPAPTLPAFGTAQHALDGLVQAVTPRAAPGVAGTGSPSAGAGSGPPEVRSELVAAPAGRAILVLAGGHAALVDGGPPAVGEALVARLRSLGIGRVDLAVMTKASDGEALGLLPVLDAMPVGRILDLAPGSTCRAHQAVLTDARAHGTAVTTGQRGVSVPFGPARFDVLWPAPETAATEPLPAGPGLVRLVDGDVRIVWAGTLDVRELPAVQRLGSQLAAQVLEVPAGGGPGALGMGLLREVRPRVALLAPTAAGPDPQVLQQLASSRVVAVEASLVADLRVQTDGRGLVLAFDPGLPGQDLPDSTTPAPGPAAPPDPCA
jgi:beta-lactamase superfamily II metal-dependent hydrolase